MDGGAPGLIIRAVHSPSRARSVWAFQRKPMVQIIAMRKPVPMIPPMSFFMQPECRAHRCSVARPEVDLLQRLRVPEPFHDAARVRAAVLQRAWPQTARRSNRSVSEPEATGGPAQGCTRAEEL